MNILYISGIYPTKNFKNGGAFIENRYRIVSKYNQCKLFRINIYQSIELASIKKILRKKVVLKSNDSDELWSIFNIEKQLKDLLKTKEKQWEILSYRLVGEIEKLYETNKIDLIHVHWCFPEGYLVYRACEKLKIPYIITAHGSDIHTNTKDKEIKKYTVQALENASKAIFVSESLLNTARELGYSGDNAVVIKNGVEIEKFKVVDKSLIKKEFNILNNKHVVGYVGRFESIKGVYDIPNIFKKIYEKNKDVIFMIIGDGSLKKSVEKELDYNSIEYLNFKFINHDELYKYYNLLDILVLPSENEGYPCTIVEAQCCGVKVVASDVGGVSEAINNYGKIIKRGDKFTEEVAESVLSIINENLHNNIEDISNEKYSWENVVKNEMIIYEFIFNNKKVK